MANYIWILVEKDYLLLSLLDGEDLAKGTVFMCGRRPLSCSLTFALGPYSVEQIFSASMLLSTFLLGFL